MHIFHDTEGREWEVRIHIAAVKLVRDMLSIDLADPKAAMDALDDPVNLVNLLYLLCRDQADKLGVSDEDFGRAMAGDAIAEATRAFLEELVAFFPNPRLRKLLGRMLKRMRELEDAELDAIDAEQLAQTTMAADETSSPTPTEPEASSASTPAPSPSASSPG